MKKLNLKFENAQIIGKQIAELMAKLKNSKLQTLSFDSVVESNSQSELIEQFIKASNEYSQREIDQKVFGKNPFRY